MKSLIYKWESIFGCEHEYRLEKVVKHYQCVKCGRYSQSIVRMAINQEKTKPQDGSKNDFQGKGKVGSSGEK